MTRETWARRNLTFKLKPLGLPQRHPLLLLLLFKPKKFLRETSSFIHQIKNNSPPPRMGRTNGLEMVKPFGYGMITNRPLQYQIGWCGFSRQLPSAQKVGTDCQAKFKFGMELHSLIEQNCKLQYIHSGNVYVKMVILPGLRFVKCWRLMAHCACVLFFLNTPLSSKSSLKFQEGKKIA